jgi:hypothetical protein
LLLNKISRNMSRYTLDYSEKQGRPLRPRRQAHPMLFVFIVGMLMAGLLVTQSITLKTENQQLRHQLDTQLLQYDSLLAAKLHADRKLAHWQHNRPPR